MPRCGNCRDGVPSECLEELWKGVLACPVCRGNFSTSLVRTRLTLLKDTEESKERTMADLKKHLVASINVFEIDVIVGAFSNVLNPIEV